MKYLFIIIFLLSFTPHHRYADGSEYNPYLKLEHDSVVIYDFDWHEGISIIDKDGHISSTVKMSKRLDKFTSDELTLRLGLKSSYGHNVAMCFEPHLGIVYYKTGKPVGHIDVCLGCNYLVSNLAIPATNEKHVSIGDQSIPLHGFSRKFRIYLNNLLVRYQFSHQITDFKSTFFD